MPKDIYTMLRDIQGADFDTEDHSLVAVIAALGAIPPTKLNKVYRLIRELAKKLDVDLDEE